MDIGDRTKQLRTALNLTQSDLAKKVGMTYVQIGRYETKKAVPSADVLNKLAHALHTTLDYLMNGTSEDVAEQQLVDRELLHLFKEVQDFNAEDKRVVKILIDALITKRQVQKLA